MWIGAVLVCLAGLFGVGGVVIGSRLENDARLRSEAETRERQRLIAARLIGAELGAIQSALEDLIFNGKWWLEDISFDWWREHAGALAGLLAEAEWSLLVSAYFGTSAGERARRAGVDPAVCVAEATVTLEKVNAAVSVLLRYTAGFGNAALEPGQMAALSALAFAGAPAVPPGPPAEPDGGD